MKSGSAIAAITALFVSSLAAGLLQAQMPSSGSRVASSFIVSCDCAKPADQARVRREIERAGGKVVYTYKHLDGFAVASRRPEEADRLERRLRRISGVHLVRPDGAVHLNPPGLPQ